MATRAKNESRLPLVPRERHSLYALQSNLQATWSQNGVDQYYQNSVLAYLDELSEKEAAEQIMREQKRMLENRSQYDRIKENIDYREQVLKNIEGNLENPDAVESVCEGIDQLRKINLALCESILNMKEHLSKKGVDAGPICEGYYRLFQKLHSDNEKIRKSFLSKVVPFGKGYDPFFLNPYESFQNKGFLPDTPRCVMKLFKMNISYVYRLIKAKNQILTCLSSSCSPKVSDSAFSSRQAPFYPSKLESENQRLSEIVEQERQTPIPSGLSKDSVSKMKKSSPVTSPPLKNNRKLKVSKAVPRKNSTPELSQKNSVPKATISLSSAPKQVIKNDIVLPKISPDKSHSVSSKMTVKKKIGKGKIMKTDPSRDIDSQDEIDQYRRNMIKNKDKGTSPENQGFNPKIKLAPLSNSRLKRKYSTLDDSARDHLKSRPRGSKGAALPNIGGQPQEDMISSERYHEPKSYRNSRKSNKGQDDEDDVSDYLGKIRRQQRARDRQDLDLRPVMYRKKRLNQFDGPKDSARAGRSFDKQSVGSQNDGNSFINQRNFPELFGHNRPDQSNGREDESYVDGMIDEDDEDEDRKEFRRGRKGVKGSKNPEKGLEERQRRLQQRQRELELRESQLARQKGQAKIKRPQDIENQKGRQTKIHEEEDESYSPRRRSSSPERIVHYLNEGLRDNSDIRKTNEGRSDSNRKDRSRISEEGNAEKSTKRPANNQGREKASFEPKGQRYQNYGDYNEKRNSPYGENESRSPSKQKLKNTWETRKFEESPSQQQQRSETKRGSIDGSRTPDRNLIRQDKRQDRPAQRRQRDQPREYDEQKKPQVSPGYGYDKKDKRDPLQQKSRSRGQYETGQRQSQSPKELSKQRGQQDYQKNQSPNSRQKELKRHPSHEKGNFIPDRNGKSYKNDEQNTKKPNQSPSNWAGDRKIESYQDQKSRSRDEPNRVQNKRKSSPSIRKTNSPQVESDEDQIESSSKGRNQPKYQNQEDARSPKHDRKESREKPPLYSLPAESKRGSKRLNGLSQVEEEKSEEDRHHQMDSHHSPSRQEPFHKNQQLSNPLFNPYNKAKGPQQRSDNGNYDKQTKNNWQSHPRESNQKQPSHREQESSRPNNKNKEIGPFSRESQKERDRDPHKQEQPTNNGMHDRYQRNERASAQLQNEHDFPKDSRSHNNGSSVSRREKGQSQNETQTHSLGQASDHRPNNKQGRQSVETQQEDPNRMTRNSHKHSNASPKLNANESSKPNSLRQESALKNRLNFVEDSPKQTRENYKDYQGKSEANIYPPRKANDSSLSRQQKINSANPDDFSNYTDKKTSGNQGSKAKAQEHKLTDNRQEQTSPKKEDKGQKESSPQKYNGGKLPNNNGNGPITEQRSPAFEEPNKLDANKKSDDLNPSVSKSQNQKEQNIEGGLKSNESNKGKESNQTEKKDQAQISSNDLRGDSEDKRKAEIDESKKINESKPADEKRNDREETISKKKSVQERSEVDKTHRSEIGVKKQVKMKPCQTTKEDLFKFLKEEKIGASSRQEFQVGQWKEILQKSLCYFTQFFFNEEIASFGICTPVNNGDYEILYWGIMEQICSAKLRIVLFKKYLQYLEKYTSLRKIFIKSSNYEDIGFTKGAKGLYSRKRLSINMKELLITPFLSIQCSNICFAQDSPDFSILYSQQIPQFKKDKSCCHPSIALCHKEKLDQLGPRMKFIQGLEDLQAVNSELVKLNMDTYEASKQIVVGKCNLMGINEQFFIASYFYFENGFFVPQGEELASSSGPIFRINTNIQGYSMYFSKASSNIKDFTANCQLLSSKPDSKVRKNFAFKIFTKQLYGRLKNEEFLGQGCYGNWDLTFAWQHQLKGLVKQQMPAAENMLGVDSFYVGILFNSEVLFAFQVNSSDYFF